MKTLLKPLLKIFNRGIRVRAALILGSCLAFLNFGACGYHHVEPVPPAAYFGSTSLSFLKDGHTTRKEIMSHFGGPSRSFEKGRIATYWLDKDFSVTGANRKNSHYSLVLVFESSEGRVLRRHSLVRIK